MFRFFRSSRVLPSVSPFRGSSGWVVALIGGLSIPLLWGCANGPEAGASVDEAAADLPNQTPPRSTPPDAEAPSFSYAGPVLDLPPDPGEGETPRPETERDWAIAAGTVAWARSQGLADMPVGELVAILGTTFVGAPYEPGTLELPGPETLVVNLRTFDCVTFVEHVVVLSHLVRDAEVAADPDPATGQAFRDTYRRLLTELRYRHASLDGYTSRLHYFTEWMNQGVERGLFREITPELDGEVDTRPIHFMTSNPDAYRQIAENPSLVEELRRVEARLSSGERRFVPQDRIAGVEEGIESGDIIAAVSTVDGLDIAHTGIALRHEGRIHLLHAPLVGDSVEISTRPLADRIQGIASQAGIRVVRPVTPSPR